MHLNYFCLQFSLHCRTVLYRKPLNNVLNKNGKQSKLCFRCLKSNSRVLSKDEWWDVFLLYVFETIRDRKNESLAHEGEVLDILHPNWPSGTDACLCQELESKLSPQNSLHVMKLSDDTRSTPEKC